MKKLLLTVSIVFIVCFINAQNDSAIFLHHSTGGGVWSEGDVSGWITDFNAGNATHYYAEEFDYPNSPWPWANYPYDYWKLWIDHSCDNTQSGIRCIDYFAARYELIILKHCYPGAGIGEDSGNPDVTSENKTLGNYKAQYRALRAMMDGMPQTKFMFWTLAPLHRNATNAADAARAHEFVEWVNNDFLKEDSKLHPNIYIFDFYSLVAELNASPANGQQYCLKFDYELDHDGDNSHPNTAANNFAGPYFGRAIVNALGNTTPIIINTTNDKKEVASGFSILPNPTSGTFRLLIQKDIQPPYTIDIIGVDGRIVKSINSEDSQVDCQLPGLEKGLYYIRLQADNSNYVEPLIIK